ncbi:hypothetical protein E2562_013044 [Oryza meyeriana var. granulata]|uniref:DUF7771 domain-containing protein n=1 Tax=Oryza meyeriana var. granulata TaxID=110450 RepID=A0A6G1DIT7_9ORYZ|nr:hypothetical protein E2562_013044 [Oryza meyeriana var. granulata]
MMAGRQAHNAFVASAIAVAAFLAATTEGAVSSWEASSDEDYHIFVENRMPENMHLSCYAVHGGGRSEFYHSFRADTGREVQLPFLQPVARARVVCKWACNGNYLRGVTLFSSSWQEATSGACRRRGGGCNVVFDGQEMYVAGRSGRGRRLLGDLPEHECQKMLLVFNRRCWYKQHRHPYVGRVMSGLTDYLMA